MPNLRYRRPMPRDLKMILRGMCRLLEKIVVEELLADGNRVTSETIPDWATRVSHRFVKRWGSPPNSPGFEVFIGEVIQNGRTHRMAVPLLVKETRPCRW